MFLQSVRMYQDQPSARDIATGLDVSGERGNFTARLKRIFQVGDSGPVVAQARARAGATPRLRLAFDQEVLAYHYKV